MSRNMEVLDRGVRTLVVAPVALVVAFIIGAGTAGGVILFVVAGIMLASSATAFCPTYTLIGISTYPSGLHHVGHHLRGGHA
jgi:Inner membrane protein YgaP-like, transmembrane domain